ncbi:molybdate ABC transporter substrate-binding protein [Microbacterium sp. NPDC055357]
MARSRFAVVLAVAALVALAGCAASGGVRPADEDPRAPSAPVEGVGPELTGELSIYAAASLGTAFDELAARFEERHPSVDVRPVVYDGSSTLARQIIEGAPADVFASADEVTMDRIGDLAAAPALFATNTLVIAVPAGNPGGVTGLQSLADPDLTVVLCAAEVPCGAASGTLLGNAGVTVSAGSLEQNVTAVLAKVRIGEADAGLVYASDVRDVAGVEVVDAEGAHDVVNRYPIAVMTDAANPAAAAAFVAFVLSDDGRAVLSARGFGSP